MGRSAVNIERRQGLLTRLVYQAGGLFEVYFDNGLRLLATNLSNQLVAAAYWLRSPVFVDFIPDTLVIQRIGDNLSDQPIGVVPVLSVSGFVCNVATQSVQSSSFEVFLQTLQGDAEFHSTDGLAQLLVETAALRRKAPQLSVADDGTIVSVDLQPGHSIAPDQRFTNICDIAYCGPDASVKLSRIPDPFLTNDPIILGVLGTAKALGACVDLPVFDEDPRRIRRVELTNVPDPVCEATTGADDCVSFLKTDVDQNGQTFLAFNAVNTDAITTDANVQILCHRAFVGGLTVALEVDEEDSSRVLSFTVSRPGFCQ